jgi:xylan 1,4-beta-xylosidase
VQYGVLFVKKSILFLSFLISIDLIFGQSVSFETFINPVIPGDHPDPTLSKIGNDFYTSGSSFNPTPKIYHSTDLVHWEVIAQPVSASWFQYGDSPGGGIWGGHTVLYNESYWHYFARGGVGMFFVKADDPAGPWSEPFSMNTSMPGLPPFGQDNSIFIDEDTGKWYLLTKAGQQNNHIVELGDDGQPTGKVFDLTWLNPNSEGNPYGWAEGPVMWKHNGHYYYSFAQHLVGAQYVMRSDTLTDEESAWTIKSGTIFYGQRATYNTPNHISPAVELDDGTSWVIAHSYNGNSEWYAHGRQGLLCQVTYDEEGFPRIQYPSNNAVQAPDLPSSGIPWTVPISDMFNSTDFKPDWSFLGYTSAATHSLEVQDGWLYLEPYAGDNTVIQNDGEHSYSLITKVDFEPSSSSDEAGLWIINGPETLSAKVFSTKNTQGDKVFAFSFENTLYEVENTIGTIVWLKLIRNEHMMSGFFSYDGIKWQQIGENINASALDIQQTDFNNFTGNQQGPYVKGGQYALFDLYIYRDAYTTIPARNPSNKFGVSSGSSYLGSINNNDWALYAGVEFGTDDYPKKPVSIEISASCVTQAGIIEVWLDSIGTGNKIAECILDTTGSLSNYQIFGADVDSIQGSHDVYLHFIGSGTSELFRVKNFRFLSQYDTPTSVDDHTEKISGIERFKLNQNYPNPFNPITRINYQVPWKSYLSLKVYNLLGEEITTLYDGVRQPGNYMAIFNGQNLVSGVYLFQLKSENYVNTKKLLLLK